MLLGSGTHFLGTAGAGFFRMLRHGARMDVQLGGVRLLWARPESGFNIRGSASSRCSDRDLNRRSAQ